MPAPNPNSPDVLSEEILAEAGRERDEIIRRANQESEALLAAAAAETQRFRREQLDAARDEAARRCELILAAIPVETGRLRAARIEAILEDIHEAARRQLKALHFDCHKSVVALAAEAIRRMPGTDFVLKIAPADQAAFGGALAGEIRLGAGRSPLNITVAADPAITSGGVIVRDAGNFCVWDNRLLIRLERLWPELRRQIAVRASLGENNQAMGGPE